MSSISSSFDNSSEKENSEEDGEFSTKEEEYDLDIVINLVGSISDILKEIIKHEENKDNKNKGSEKGI